MLERIRNVWLFRASNSLNTCRVLCLMSEWVSATVVVAEVPVSLLFGFLDKLAVCFSLFIFLFSSPGILCKQIASSVHQELQSALPDEWVPWSLPLKCTVITVWLGFVEKLALFSSFFSFFSFLLLLLWAFTLYCFSGSYMRGWCSLASSSSGISITSLHRRKEKERKSCLNPLRYRYWRVFLFAFSGAWTIDCWSVITYISACMLYSCCMYLDKRWDKVEWGSFITTQSKSALVLHRVIACTLMSLLILPEDSRYLSVVEKSRTRVLMGFFPFLSFFLFFMTAFDVM